VTVEASCLTAALARANKQRVPGLSYQAAQQLTFVIDEEGQAAVAVLPLQQAQAVSQALQQYGLTSSIEPFSVNEDDLKE
jgi:ATP-dependent Clp protease adapter protein ClpS